MDLIIIECPDCSHEQILVSGKKNLCAECNAVILDQVECDCEDCVCSDQD